MNFKLDMQLKMEKQNFVLNLSQRVDIISSNRHVAL